MMYQAIVLVSVGILQLSSAQIVQNAQCDPNIAVVANFNLQEFLGHWYEVARSPNPNQGADCLYHQFDNNNTTNTTTYYNRGVNKNFLEEITGTVISDGTAQLILNLTTGNVTSELDFSIILTDYSNYAVAYRCENISTTQRNVYLWHLGRTTTPSELVTAMINVALINLLGINIAELERLDHSETACYVLPVIEANQPVILPGQCDVNITVVQNFDVAAFTGEWNEIASYYSENALGACPRAQYTLQTSGVEVINSQVINQTLFTISGNATLASTDGSGKLLVTLEVVTGVFAQQELFIIATDYTNYAISYTCVNMDNSTKRVYSWILGRSRQFSDNTTAQVNAVVDSIIDLNQAYYVEANRTDDACFYYPDPVPGQTVVFRGQCDLNIPAMPNFDPARYMGLWHDIESYPSTFQQGTCNNAFYSLNNGTVDVYNTQVLNQTLDYINGYAVLASGDGSAKLSVTFPIIGTNLTITTSYWVLDTDYDSFAFVYTCENLSDDSRVVFSWKLSRTKQLTAAGSAVINNITSTNPVLDQRYYEANDQSAEGCFYYPEPQQGVPVVFPGQCDDNITVVNNFNLSQFLGIWNEIEAYPKEEQDGSCINHVYTAGTANNMSLQSSSVVDQFLQVSNSTVGVNTTDGSAKLVITLDTNGTQIQIPFWILNTDYSDYALAYSCVNINSDFRSIYSWKLSRTKSLSAAAQTIINDTIASIQVLDNAYYETIDQSDDACFYLPEYGPGEPIVLFGQCDPNITVVQNFDVAAFTGEWNEIASYYSENALGACPRAQYTLQNSGVEVINSQVINQTLFTISGNATLASTDGSGKLLVTLEVIPGVFAQQELFIIATDYTNYALSYSCVNIDNSTKRVYSWILGRSRQLSDNATAQITAVINSLNDLNQAYYVEANRTDDACFYYPDPVPGQTVVFRGQCDLNIPAMPNFDPARYMGLWHDIESYPSTFQQGTCNNAFYSLNNGTVDVYNTQVLNQTLDYINGYAVLASDDGSAKLSVTFPIIGTNLTITTSYWVLDTDYDSYAFVYTCENLSDDSRVVFSWKLSRTKQLTAAGSAVINNITSTNPVLDQRYYEANDQSAEGCFYYPEPQQGVPVVFPGQCDDNITVVNNFNLSQFLGIWNEIEAYPKEEQDGSCINHVYTAGTANNMSLQSSSVVDQFLQVSNSTVGVNTTDGSAKLVITLDTNGTQIQIPFWILNTDYSDYALAYSCVNINSDFRSIYSWKLSRTKSLSAAAQTIINDTIASIQVLDNAYYETIDQSDDACFYLPEYGPGEPIVLFGQCDPNITVVQNFDVAAFTGEWNEIASYYSENALGACPRAQYTLQNSGVEVINSQVINQTLFTISGNATLASTDGSGKLLVTLEVIPGVFAQQELFIIATDYTNYALSYSCVNIDNSTKRVYSWILGRSRQLSDNATAQITAVINSLNDLNQAYYVEANRTDDACFYYPDPVPGQTVVFRGQCDLNIPAMPNFDPARYMGLWHDIESYPSTFQQGTCNNAFYSLNNGTVDVYNTQVLNQTLDYINGYAVLASDDGSAKLSVTFPIIGTNLTITTSYWVLDTDYDSYAFVYTCENLSDDSRVVFSWKLSRTKQLTAAGSAVINNITSTNPVLDQRYYEANDQSAEGCFYYPEPQQGVPVVFPGQCDDNITVVNNFNLSQFLGIWNEIEAYPKEEQDGSCINHVYTAGTANNMSLQSSSVVDQFLQLSNSTVGFNTTDGSAKLVITLDTNGTQIQIPFWILNTDYSDYALAYSCVNINSDFRSIYSWKLSRTKSLSAAAQTIINDTIASIQVLDNAYYETIDQSDDACFYLPEYGPGEPIVLFGQCDPNITVVQNFDVAAFTGEWNEIASYYSENALGACPRAQYTLQNSGVEVINSQVINQTLFTISGNATLASTDGSGKLLVTLEVIPGVFAQQELFIIATDYTNYALSYSCVNIDNSTKRVYSWILGRSRQLSDNATAQITAVINSLNDLNQAYYVEANRTDDACFYYPDPVPGQTVIFRGQCDLNIPAMPNFDPARYMGLWHDIESYPSTFQQGTCNNAFYSLNNGTVDVYNTQVLNQTLDYINGYAVLASDDGSAKLSVTFPIIGTNLTITTSYWVLDTDYDSYAFVYTCENLSDDSRLVFSWKLSRTKQLTAAASVAINNITSTNPVLDQRYYEANDQSAEGCFYYPEPQLGVPVVFPGQCDENITVVNNFNISQFQGTWYEIEAYPKDDQIGQCINHQYTPGANNTLDLQTFSVSNLALDVSNSSMSFNSSDNSARLVITLTATNGSVITIPFWILTTDYNDYALAYSCVNIDSDYRGVYSWKLSRTKSLSTNANNSINTAIASVPVLDNVYYENINQTDEGCFYLPELNTNEPVIFVGQCDPNIQVEQNFTAQRFAGRWFDIESYFDDYTGDCKDSTFTQVGNGFDVLFTQVVNETLDSTQNQASIAVDGSGKLTVTANNASSEYWILATDYDSYALVYSCNNLSSDSRRVRSWKLSRTRELTNASSIVIGNIVSNVNVLNERYYNVRNHSDAACFYYPEPIPGQAVVFRGQCDESIAVVQNFNVERYLGTWYDIQSYPQQFQDGTCATATYSLGADGVDVYNTQVVAQLLDTINGTAVLLNSTDGSAKLMVTFPIAGTNFTIESPYWVLATDYDTYSFVYSCSNIDTEYRRVSAWKLSRQQTLDAASTVAINNIMNNINVLDQQYFRETGQSAEDCFFYPDNFGGPVYLDGQCPQDNAISVVANLSATAFGGTWYEISRFPSELQIGECAASNFNSTGTNSFSLIQTIIYDERLNTTIGTATASADGRGVLSLALTGNNVTTNMNLYILDTDYTEFALVYSCINRSNTTKQIYSWKLSRNRAGLSDAANEKIDQAVSNHTDLHEIYYDITDQSNYGCFYYPQYDTLPEIITLSGPCNTTIQAKTNFDANAYLGRWFETARFPDPNQRGTCSRAEYGLGANVVTVYNSEVINSTLGVQNGTAVVSSVDGSGLLSVTFEVNGITFVADYYVLETDYTTFSLVYSCRNTTDGNRQVTSWKLSRTPTNTNESNTIMNTVIANTQGLIEEYYTPTSQTDEDCFYIPEVDVNSAPVFRGACENVTGVANFDVQQYIGWWHEIERYPIDQTIGECISSQYQQSGSGYVVVETSVMGDSANVSSAAVTVTADGRLTKTYSDGRIQESWVLATDYQTYSLLYTCETFNGANNDVYRRVWSAKHSKSRQLTAAAQTAMNPIIEANKVLYPQFYQQVNQNNSACFHYPELTGSTVVLPGLCDENIPVVQDFDIYGYTGSWYLIERYPHPNISSDSSCIGTRYSVSDDDNVTVLNWKVIGEELTAVEGNVTVGDNGRLTITLPAENNGTTSVVIQILDTDYTTYSVVYTCENINDFQRVVTAYKLSRTRSLPATAASAINTYMAQREELHQPYFITVTQDEDCDEPSSGYLAKSSGIVVLACAILQLMFWV